VDRPVLVSVLVVSDTEADVVVRDMVDQAGDAVGGSNHAAECASVAPTRGRRTMSSHPGVSESSEDSGLVITRLRCSVASPYSASCIKDSDVVRPLPHRHDQRGRQDAVGDEHRRVTLQW